MSEVLSYTWHHRDGALVRRGYGDPPPEPEPEPAPEFTIGTTRPTTANIGIPEGTVLTPHYGNLTVTQPGRILDKLDIHGKLSIQAAGVRANTCRVRGDSSTTVGDVISCTNSDAADFVANRCEIYRDTPNEAATGVIGHGYTLHRCHIYHCVDGTGVFDTANQDGDMAILVEGCLMEKTSYFRPCSYQSDNQTHNDVGTQIQGGRNIVFRGCDVKAFIDPTVGVGVDLRDNPPSYAHMAAFIIGANLNGGGQVADITIDQCWIDGGTAGINVSEKGRGPISGLTITNNRFGRSAIEAEILIPSTTTAISTIFGNVYEDNGAPVPVSAGA